MTPRDSLGWPVERIIGKPFTNFIRIMIHTDIWKTWNLRNWKPEYYVDSNAPTQQSGRSHDF